MSSPSSNPSRTTCNLPNNLSPTGFQVDNSEHRNETSSSLHQSNTQQTEHDEGTMDGVRRTGSVPSLDRKRRLTGNGGESGSGGTTTPRRRVTVTSSQGLRGHQGSDRERPLPSLPHDLTSSHILALGSDRERPIDLTSSSPSHPPLARRQSNHRHYYRETTARYRSDVAEYSLPRWQLDDEVTNCPICHTQFSFWYRKHHCRKCGRVVCSSCSPHRITIPRQFIVRPPEQHRRSFSLVGEPSHVIDLTDDSTASSSLPRPIGQQLNPALGGGEEVRLCNPCVPDPNPDPPLGYGPLRSQLEIWSGTDWGSSSPSLTSRSVPRPSPFPPPSGLYDPQTQPEQEQRRYRRRSHMVDDLQSYNNSSQYREAFGFHGARNALSTLQGFGGRQRISLGSSPPYGSPPEYERSQPQTGQTHHSGPASTYFSDSMSGPSSHQNIRVRSMIGPERSSHAYQQPSPRLDERDICPVCSRPLPPRGQDGNEEAREAHVRDCIQGSSQTRHSPAGDDGSPTEAVSLMRMLVFSSTEKDCVNEDGSAQECTICMEEYEVGETLARLECLCKFHRDCIAEWFERKKECPVHKIR